MKKTFCDCCSEEITNQNEWNISKVVSVLHGKYTVSLHNSIPPAPQPGMQTIDVCKYCLIDAVKQLDDRPIAAPVDYKRLGYVDPEAIKDCDTAVSMVATFCPKSPFSIPVYIEAINSTAT